MMIEPRQHTIYMIHDATHRYIGVTSDFQTRMRRHKFELKSGSENRLYSYIREVGGWAHMHKIILRQWECTPDEARTVESKCIAELSPNLNTRQGQCQAFREYRENEMPSTIDRKTYSREYNRIWRKVNLDQYKQTQAQWRENHKDYQAEWKRVNKDRLARKAQLKKEFKALCMIEV